MIVKIIRCPSNKKKSALLPIRSIRYDLKMAMPIRNLLWERDALIWIRQQSKQPTPKE